MNQYHRLSIRQIREETIDTRSFVFDSLDRTISYKPGQFLTLVFPGRISEERRSYSISSTNLLNEPLTITVKRIENGSISRYLFDQCREGDELLTIGASGFFTLPERINTVSRLFFFAAGSGITPVFSLIKSALLLDGGVQITLVYSNASKERTIFFNEIRDLAQRYAHRIEVHFLFSDSKNLLRARLSKALVAELISGKKTNTLFYLCGPHAYMQMISIVLLTEGVPAENLRKEIFDTVKPLTRALPPDQEKHLVTLRYAGATYSFHVQYPETILAAAKRNAVPIPYSCEAGKCGTCAATCLEGKVWMSYNEVLLDQELERGRILTCTAFPVGGDAELLIASE